MAEWGAVEVDGQRVAYEWLQVDVRSEQQRKADAVFGRLRGDPAVVIPGHGQTVAAPRKLTAAAAALSEAGIAWCIDITPPVGGDPVKARALGPIVRERIIALFPARPDVAARAESTPAEIASLEPLGRDVLWADPLAMTAAPSQATLLGWSHGGGEALRSAGCDPVLFPRVAALCPAGLIERRPSELLTGFLLEVTRIVCRATARRDWAGLRNGLRVGFDILRGMAQDLIRSRSARRVLDDIRWASRKVPGTGFGYNGDVALVFARDDTVIRWQAVFPGCAAPDEIPVHLDAYQNRDFPAAGRLRIAVLEGDHLSPAVEEEYARAAFALLEPVI